MTHDRLEELLGAYALDAVDPSEAFLVEAHLDECPRCRAELAQHREVASLFSASPNQAPSPLWQRISDALAEPDPECAGRPALAPLVPLGVPRDAHRKVRAASGALGVVAAAAAVVAVILSMQLVNIHRQLDQVRAAVRENGLAAAVSAALVAPHRDAVLTSIRRQVKAEVVITPNGESYWVHSSLPVLQRGETYQVWAVVNGRTVSLGLVGRNPSRYAAFRLGEHCSRIMVTAEPAGGAVSPTTPILLSDHISG